MSCPSCGGDLGDITLLSPRLRKGVANCLDCPWMDTPGMGVSLR